MNSKVLVVYAHPDPNSFCGAIRDLVVRTCTSRGSEVRVHDLYDESFSAVMSANEWRLRSAELASKPHLSAHCADVVWCDTLVFVYPTWWSAQPAILKAWVDRVLANDVAWSLDPTTGHALPTLRNVRRILVITTHGRSKLVNFWCGQIGRFTLVRAVRRLCSWRCRAHWTAMYSLDRSTRYERDRFMQRVERRVRRVA
jgi:putative NADPH-quinone reductase